MAPGDEGRSAAAQFNEMVDSDPTLREALSGLFGGASRQTEYRFWRLKKGVARNRYEVWYAYGTKRSLGPNGRHPTGWWSWAWTFKADRSVRGRWVGYIGHAARSATRKKAKARAYRLYAQARGWEDTEYTQPRKTVKLPPAPPAPKACEGCGRETGALTWTRAVPLWLCETCRSVTSAPAETANTTGGTNE
jgi:hypothetical protein